MMREKTSKNIEAPGTFERVSGAVRRLPTPPIRLGSGQIAQVLTDSPKCSPDRPRQRVYG